MFWIRLIPIAFFSLSAISLLAFQSIEIVHAITDLIFQKSRLK
ncbi:hypothetical protein [Falsibacillus pallidus]|uniref:Uncharacterized protein n=1 Tax=Falsibacillus pallidus TaxID=493781 RepID=A0A370GH88_9BACI|nr:hypothetical protein DFR59_104223 [Falsibacillus pallidus]